MLAGGLLARLRTSPHLGLVQKERFTPREGAEAQGGARQFWTLWTTGLEAARWILGCIRVVSCPWHSCWTPAQRLVDWTLDFTKTLDRLVRLERWKVYIGGLTLDTAVGILDSG